MFPPRWRKSANNATPMVPALSTPVDKIPVGLWAQFRRQSWRYGLGMVFLALYQGAQYIFNVYLEQTTNIALEGKTQEALRLGGLLISLAVASLFVRVLSRMAIFDGGRIAEYELRKVLLWHLQKLGPSFYRRVSTGDIMSRVTNDLTQIRLLLGFGVLNLINTVFALISALTYTFHTSTRLTLAALVPLPFLVILMRGFAKRMFTYQRTNQEALGSLSARVQRCASGIRVVRSFGLEPAEEKRFLEENEHYVTHSLRLAQLRGAVFPLMQALTALGIVSVVWYGSHLILVGELTSGALVAFLRAMGQLTWPLISVGFLLSVVQRGRAAYTRVKEIYDAVPDIVEGEHALPAPVRGELVVRNLTFSYGNTPALRDVSLTLPAGRSLGIVGRTGSGKSTLVSMLCRLYPTPRGAVFLDGVDICDLPLQELRSAVAYAQQEPFLFSTTAARNVGYVLPEADSELALSKIRSSAQEAQILEELEDLPDGLDTVVGERGVQLSGGQKQRISLARAFLSGPRVLILDDPLSAVDSKTEHAILAAIERQKTSRSIVLVTHRISAAAQCDSIVVLDAGRVVEAGTHQELLALGGLYATFAEEQRVERELASLDEFTTASASQTGAL